MIIYERNKFIHSHILSQSALIQKTSKARKEMLMNFLIGATCAPERKVLWLMQLDREGDCWNRINGCKFHLDNGDEWTIAIDSAGRDRVRLDKKMLVIGKLLESPYPFIGDAAQLHEILTAAQSVINSKPSNARLLQRYIEQGTVEQCAAALAHLENCIYASTLPDDAIEASATTTGPGPGTAARSRKRPKPDIGPNGD
jgi:hypothetical protein